VQLDGVEPAIHYALEHLPNWLKQPDPPVVPLALWYQNNYAPKHLTGDDAMGPTAWTSSTNSFQLSPCPAKFP
jgi:hypothetical protein